jgi:hypothetical protein
MHTPSLSLRLAAATLWLGLIAPFAAHAESFASSASSAGSASLGSSSDSIKGSSNSSSGDNKVADGDYQVLDVTALADHPGMLRLRLQQPQLVAGGREGGAFTLDLPEKALGPRGVTTGELVSVRNREYGIEFARAQTHEAFFLVLDDAWHHELDPRPVTAF